LSSAHPPGLRRPSAIRGARYQAAGRGPHRARRGGGDMGSVCNAERSTPRSPNQSCDADGYAKARRHQLPARALHAALVSAFAGEFRHRREARRRDCASKSWIGSAASVEPSPTLRGTRCPPTGSTAELERAGANPQLYRQPPDRTAHGALRHEHRLGDENRAVARTTCNRLHLPIHLVMPNAHHGSYRSTESDAAVFEPGQCRYRQAILRR
jgi:hypothetical protein